MVEGEHWLRKNWTTPVLLLGVFLVALYLRAYFPWELAIPNGLLSGGSDAFYYHRIIQHIAETGTHLTNDPLLNYPMGLENPRPPLFAWTTAVVGKVLSPLFPNLGASVTFAFLGSTALWGSLTVFPLYFLTKEAFGKRVGILTSFFLAVLPAHLQRSPATNGDHDAMVLFFVVSGFYFFLKSLKSLNEKRWVDDWRLWRKEGRTSLRQGLGVFFAENRKSLLYAALAGWCVATIALTWQGWAYAPIILLVYFLFQVLVHRLRNQDPMGVTIAFGVAIGLPLLFAAPWYFGTYGQVGTWYDVPFYLFVLALGVGFVFTATRDYPWALVLPIVAVFGGAALLVATVVNPSIGAAFLSGAGYFVRTKAYETIAEAQPPGLSQIILSFGVATYFLALFALLWMARGIPKHPKPDYLFVVVWAIAAIFMAQAAARFIFNAAPAFAMASAWMVVLFLDFLRFDDLKKKFRSLGGGFVGFRRSVRARHVLGSLIVVFIFILPNVWFGVDAAIPFERKSEFDRQVYGAMPDFLRPSNYDQISQTGSSFYFGAFGYSLPLEREYFPAAWSWFRDVDAHINPVEDRPAFLSWWDYGFESVDVGAHPTVADNFLDGYHLAGNFITAQSEDEAIALLNMRLLEGDFFEGRRRSFSPEGKAAITSFGLAWQPLDVAFRNPAEYIDDVMGDPNRYGRYENLQAANARYIWGGQYLMDALDTEQLTAMNHALRGVVGASIRYFAVDTRLFPLDGQNTGIFYAPAKLSDHRILEMQDGRSVPRDFFDIRATTSNRGVVNLEEVRDTDQVTDLSMRYKDLFYNSMFYRAFVGFSPTVAGLGCNDCIPGLPAPNNQGMASILPMQAWNLSHFRVVYKTAYYNPFPREEIVNHTDAWRAVEYKEAVDLQGKINRGEATGIVDSTPTSLIRRGIVFLKYYDGAFLNGTVTLDGVPWPNVRVTVHDDYDIPHDTVLTGADGRYSVLLPFGDTHVAYSIGTADNRTMTGATTVHELRIPVSDEASMREDVDADGDGIADWKLTRDVDVAGATRSGSVFLDVDRDSKLDAGEPLLAGADLTFQGTEVDLERTARTAADGTFRVAGLYAGNYNVSVAAQGRTFPLANVTVGEGRSSEDLVVVPTTIQGRILDEDGRRLEGAGVTLTDRTNGTRFRAVSAKDGFFNFQGLLAGSFDVDATKEDRAALPSRAFVPAGTEVVFHNVTVYPGSPISVQTTLGGTRQGFVTLTFEQRSSARLVRVVTTDGDGRATVSLPRGTWDVHARHYAGSALWVFVSSLEVRVGEPLSLTASLGPGAAIGGVLYNADNRTEVFGAADVYFRSASGQYRVRSDFTGEYLAHLPLGTWTVQSSYLEFPVYEVRTITGDARIDLTARRGVTVQGTVLREFLSAGPVTVEDPVSDATVRFSDTTRTFETITGGDGRFEVSLPATGTFALRVTRPGFVTLDGNTLSAFDWQQASRVSIVAEDVVISGSLRLEGALVTDPTLELIFEPQSPGAVSTQANLDGAGGYRVSVQPGRYHPLVDRDLAAQGDTRLQTRDDLSLFVALDADPLAQDLALVVRHRVSGPVTLNGLPANPTIRFEGPDVRETNATSGSFSTFLAAGTYTVTANATERTDHYLALQRLDVSGPTTLAVTLRLATNVTGTVAFAGSPVPDVPVAFTRTEGATVSATSDSFGQYNVLVLGGAYSVTVDHAGTTTLNEPGRHVRYSFDGSLTVRQDDKLAVFNVNLGRSLDNTTVEGTVRFNGAPSVAQLSFVARGGNGMNATAASGSDGRYTLDMQGGEYHAYAIAPLEGAVFLGTFELLSGPTRTFDISLVPGHRLSGTTTIQKVRAAANITFSTSGGRAYVTTNAAGTFSILLPANSYDVEATTSGTERGIHVSYRDRATKVLTEPDVLPPLDMRKVVRREVGLTWDESERTEISPGSDVVYTLSLTNLGNSDDTFVLSASLPGFTFTFSSDRVAIPFGSTANTRAVQVTISAASDARVDHAPITVNAESSADSAIAKSVSLQLDVTRYRRMSADVSPSAPTWDGRFLEYTLSVKNEGNGQESFQLTLPNEQELRSSGWRPSFVSSAETGTVLNVTVAGNTTSSPVLRLEKVGGFAGVTVNVQVTNTADATQSDLVTVRAQLPALVLEGRVRAVGPGISLLEPGIDTATAAFLISIVATIAAAVYLSYLRRRSR